MADGVLKKGVDSGALTLLKRPEHLTDAQESKLAELLQYNHTFLLSFSSSSSSSSSIP